MLSQIFQYCDVSQIGRTGICFAFLYGGCWIKLLDLVFLMRLPLSKNETFLKSQNKFQFCQSDSRHNIEKFGKAFSILTKSSNLIKKWVNEMRRARSSNLTPHFRNVSFFETGSLIRKTKSSNLIQQPPYKNAKQIPVLPI